MRQRVPRFRWANALAAGVVVASLAAGLLLSRRVASGGEGRAVPPNVLLVVIDTLRRDHVGVYGASRPTTPALDAFSRHSVVFEQAWSTSSWTKPAIASLFTGQWPSRHGCREVFGGLSADADTLAERLGRLGYARRGVVSHRLVAGRSQLDQGFERYRSDHARGNRYASTVGVIDQAIEDLDDLVAGSGSTPFFLFVHLFDPHALYLRHAGVGFAGERAGRVDGSESLDRLRELATGFTPEERDLVTAIYDEEIRHVDDGLARLFARLRRLEVWDETAIVVTADHGEELGQRGWLEHTRTLHEELVGVPLLVKPPGRGSSARGARHELPVSLVDLAPTILEWASNGNGGSDGGASTQPLDGQSLVPLLQGEQSRRRPLFAEVSYRSGEGDPVGHVEKRAVRFGRMKLVENLLDGRVALFDLDADRMEGANLASARPAEVAALRALFTELEAAASGARPAPPDQRDEEDRALLRSLGYTGGGG